ncbi:MAG: ATP-binding protein [Candidatus Eisenbacteria bacterium]
MRALPRGIGTKLFLVFSITALPTLVAAGLLLEWQARRALEAELGRRVEALAVAVATSIPEETWRFAFSLGPGEEESRTARHLRGRLDAVRVASGAERLAVWDLQGRVVVDSETLLPIGSMAPRAHLLTAELDQVRAGLTASTPLFQAVGGRRVKVGLAPIHAPAGDTGPARLPDASASGGSVELRARGLPLGVLVVEAPSQSLGVVRAMRGTLAAAGLAGLLLVLAGAFIVSRLIAGRIHRLAEIAGRMETGDLASTVPFLGRDEIGDLAKALEAMRGAVHVRERQLRAMLGGVAHEIRNPLGGLVLYAEMLSQAGELSPARAAHAQRILAEANRLEKVVADFLVFARPEPPEGERVNLVQALEESGENARAALLWRGALEIEASVEAVWCDGGHLRQILLNLMRNAMQAAGPEGRVRVRAARSGDGGGSVAGEDGGPEARPITRAARAAGVVIRIEDSGCGIAAEEVERVFEPFHSTRAQGAGLGLAIVRRLCELNGIGITVGRSSLGGALLLLAVPAGVEG